METWDDNPGNDWRTVFNKSKLAITHSRYSAKAVRKGMGNVDKALQIDPDQGHQGSEEGVVIIITQ